MKCDLILTGVGGQGVLSAAVIIATAAVDSGLNVKQSEIHGMSQRGGSVVAHLRLSDRPIASDIVSLAGADIILGAEMLEAVRCLPYLSGNGWLVVSQTQLATATGYPAVDLLHNELRTRGHLLLLETETLARSIGSVRTSITVLLGAASALLPIPAEVLSLAISRRFASKGSRLVDANAKAFEAGRLAAESCRSQPA